MKTDSHPLMTPKRIATERFDDAEAAVTRLELIYDTHTAFLRDKFAEFLANTHLRGRVRATYPEILIETTSYARIDSRLSYGHVAGPGVYSTTVTQPSLCRAYLVEQLRLLMRNHGVQVEIGSSSEPIPLHFAFPDGIHVEAEVADKIERPLRDIFDVPDLAVMDDAIVNGTHHPALGTPRPLAPFTASRVDYSLHRLPHYTATKPAFFQNFVIFTNYQFYVDEFVARSRRLMASGASGYESFIEPGNLITPSGHSEPVSGIPLGRLPQMPAYHLTRPATPA